jgi:hypothetical protein
MSSNAYVWWGLSNPDAIIPDASFSSIICGNQIFIHLPVFWIINPEIHVADLDNQVFVQNI